MPAKPSRGRFTGLHTTTTHHNQHHRRFSSNYGLYFTFWDRAMGTLHADYHAEFDRVAARGRAVADPRVDSGVAAR